MYNQQQAMNMNSEFGGNNGAIGGNGISQLWNQQGISGMGQREGMTFNQMNQMQQMQQMEKMGNALGR